VVRPGWVGVTPHPLWCCGYQARLVGLLCCVVLPRLRLHSRCVARTLLCAYSRPPSDTGTMWSMESDRGCGNRRLVSIGSPQSAHTVAVRRIRFLIRRHGRPALRRWVLLLGVAMLGEGGLLCGGGVARRGGLFVVPSLRLDSPAGGLVPGTFRLCRAAVAVASVWPLGSDGLEAGTERSECLQIRHLTTC